MNRVVWIALVALLAGIAIGRLSVSTTSVSRTSAVAGGKNSTAPTESSLPKNASTQSASNAAGTSGDIYSEIKNVLSANGTSQLYDSFGKFSYLINENNVGDVLAFAEKIPQKEQRDALILLVLGRWAEIDPKAALEFGRNISTASTRGAALSNALSSWAQRDPAAAMAWAQQMPAGTERDRTVQAVLATLSEKDPPTALSILQSLPAEKSRQHFYWPIFSRWALSDPLRAAESAAQLTNHSSREIS